jgi:hypothetical protein
MSCTLISLTGPCTEPNDGGVTPMSTDDLCWARPPCLLTRLPHNRRLFAAPEINVGTAAGTKNERISINPTSRYTVIKGSRVSRPQPGCHYQTPPGRDL